MIRFAAAGLVLVVCMSSTADEFRKHKKLLRAGPNPSFIVARDLNGDGLPEIITADIGRLRDPREEVPAHDQLSLLVALGNLEYEPQPQLKTGFAPYYVVVENMDGLKAPDIVVGNFLAARNRDISLFRNLGEDLFEPVHFEAPDEQLPYARVRDGDDLPVFTKPGITAMAIRDFDGDGYRDVVATAWSSDALLYFAGDADEYLLPPVVIPLEGGPRDVVAGRFDDDPHYDLAVVLYDRGEVAMMKGDGQGQFRQAGRFVTRGRLPTRIRTKDVNQDGHLDLAVSHAFSDDSVVLFLGDGAFGFGASQEIGLGENRERLEHEIRDFVLEDLNGDEKVDLAAACYQSRSVVVLLNTSPDGKLPQRFKRETYTFEEGRPRALTAADLDGDGDMDLAVALWEANAVALLVGK